MDTNLRTISALILSLLVVTGCSDVGRLSNSDQQDSTNLTAFNIDTSSEGRLLSAFYGLDDAIPFIASYRICGEFGHTDGMPVMFSKELDLSTMQAGDFLVTLADGQALNVGCATPAPAEGAGELRTMLLVGDFGSINNQPVTVKITGHILSADQKTNFNGASVDVTPLEAGPFLVLAEPVPESAWELGKEATGLRFGGGDGCPVGTTQIIRAVWAGGVTKPGGDEVDDLERSSYSVFVEGDEGLLEVTPFAIGDLGDGDNNHELCLDTDSRAIRVEFPENLMTDPREDLNPATSITVSYES